VLSVEQMAKMIDHSILLPGQGDRELEAGVEIALKYNVWCVVPKPFQVTRVRPMLRGSDVKLCTTVSFPQGLQLPETKRYEAERAIDQGCHELDMVINISALKSGDYDYVERDIHGVVAVAARYAVPVKVILETYLLTDEEKVMGCQLAEKAGARFVKTSTATQPGGATVEDIRLMRATVGPNVVVKASGFVTDADKALALYDAGARRYGTAFTVPILEGLRAKLEQQSAAAAR
jgi:deoxyribose-phosphate aldolase